MARAFELALKISGFVLNIFPQTIMDSSRVLVMEAGHVKEFDTPAALLSNHDSAFYKMAKDAGLVASDQH